MSRRGAWKKPARGDEKPEERTDNVGNEDGGTKEREAVNKNKEENEAGQMRRDSNRGPFI